MAVDAFTMAALVVIYLAATLVIGYIGYKKTKTADDYLVAGRAATRRSSRSPTARPLSPPPPSSVSAGRRQTSGWA